MIVFKTFLKVLNKCKMPVILFTVILLFFGTFSIESNKENTNFVESKPDIAIVNNGKFEGLTKNLIDYLTKHSNVLDIKESDLDDALFYRDVSYIIYIPESFEDDIFANQNPQIDIKSTGDYEANIAEMYLNRYIKTARVYASKSVNKEEIIKNINESLKSNTEVSVTSKLDTTSITKLTTFYNFANYSFLAGGIYVICLILSSFKNDNIRKRTIISSMNYKKYNRELLLSNSLFMICLWLFYLILSIILFKEEMFTYQGLILGINSFLFSMCALTIAFLIGNLITDKNAINGIINVIALGSSFLCGAFVPMEWLPNSIIMIAHILPSYYYIKSNELLKTTEVFTFEGLKPILTNMVIILIFIIIFMVLARIVARRKQKLG